MAFSFYFMNTQNANVCFTTLKSKVKKKRSNLGWMGDYLSPVVMGDLAPTVVD